MILFLFQSLGSSRWEIKANRNRAFRVFIRDEDVQRLVKWAKLLSGGQLRCLAYFKGLKYQDNWKFPAFGLRVVVVEQRVVVVKQRG